MTVKELLNKYYFHDSCITNIDFDEGRKKIEITMDFCQWAQDWFVKGSPENIWLKLTLFGIDSYEGIVGEIDYFSIVEAKEIGDTLLLMIEDDYHEAYYQYSFSPSDVDVEILGEVKD